MGLSRYDSDVLRRRVRARRKEVSLIYPYDHSMLRRWNRGELQVRIDVPGRRLPTGYCDGSDEDEAELRQITEDEGVEELPIDKRILKTGRQIWTVGSQPELDFEGDDDDD